MARAPATTTARVSRMPTVAPARPSPGSQRDEDPEQPAGRRGEDRQRAGRRGRGSAPPTPRIASVTAGASRRVPAGQPGDRQPEPDERAEDQEEAQVGASSPARSRRSRGPGRARWRAPRRPPRPARAIPTTVVERHGRCAQGRPRRPRTRTSTTTKTSRLIAGSSRLGVGAVARAVRRRRRSARSPAGRRPAAATARIATAPPSVATRPADRSCSSGSGVPPRLVRTRSAPVSSRHEADPDAQDVSPVDDRQDRQGGQGEPGGRRQGGAGRRARRARGSP